MFSGAVRMRSVVASLNDTHETSIKSPFKPLQQLLVDEGIGNGRYKLVIRPEQVLKIHVHKVSRFSPVCSF